MLMQVISNMRSSLQELGLGFNYFSSLTFQKLMKTIAECGVCSTLNYLGLDCSANFDSDESVRKFADIIAIAPEFERCSFFSQVGNRNVMVEI